ncbi:MAG: PKD domain-containing protein [Thermoguttaceae bacterium]|nr:PKD domain-containing protein [Thermoguttaceae bacterium]MDW8037311.1 PKD domain-containing protein [Thermoguttaceae bacterium]
MFWFFWAVGLGIGGAEVLAQSFKRAGTEFQSVRTVVLTPAEVRPIIVVEFYHHGQINAEGTNVLVFCRGTNKPVPTRILQLGPGDFCRLAFETVSGQTTYEIFYGGNPPEGAAVPAWTNRDGLLLETRKYKDCNPHQLDSVRKAFESSERIGSDYVEGVFHAGNPFSLKPGPFLSRYSGYLHISQPGTYGFFTSSQDASFLLIDGKEVVSHPGVHGPHYQARPGLRKEIQLKPGAYKFEYYHVAVGDSAIMVAAWEPSPGPPDKPKPSQIPPEVFRAHSVGRATPGPVQMKDAKLFPDFQFTIRADVPLPDSEEPLIVVEFKDISPAALTGGGLARWDFGDGQTAQENHLYHVYLRPGLYTVKLGPGRRTGKPLEIANRIYIDRPVLTRRDEKNLPTLDQCLPILDTYDASKLDAASLRQLVLVYQTKADQVAAAFEPAVPANPEEGTSPTIQLTPELVAKMREAVRPWIQKAVKAGQAPFLAESPVSEDADLYNLVRVVGPMARDQLGDSQLALRIWQGAAAKIKTPSMQGHCLVEAADIAITDLVQPDKAKPLLEQADKLLAETKTGLAASRLHTVWGDYYAATGQGPKARQAYAKAEEVLGTYKAHAERTAWMGAHSRSTEEFLKTGQLERAAAQLRQWQQDFPTEKLAGYLHLLYARYWAARRMYDQVLALNEQLQTAAPDAPYADQLMLLAAECDWSRGQTDRAVATLKDLLNKYPGSPLVNIAKDWIQRIQSGARPKLPKTKP